MPDPRVQKLALVMVQYSLGIKPDQKVYLQTTPAAHEFNLAFYEEAIKAGAHVTFAIDGAYYPGAQEIFLKHASKKQLEWVSPVRKLMIETYDARMVVEAETNTRELASVNPERIALWRKANAPMFKKMLKRIESKELRWCLTVYPTEAMAQEANMSLSDYSEFVYEAGMLNAKDPVKLWKAEKKKQQKLVNWLKGKNQVTLKGENIDLSLSIKGRRFIPCAGDQNFPDGEIFTSPVENSVNGWVRFRYPAIFDGQEIEDIELWFENGKVVQEKAARNQELLTAQLNTDQGARILGEWGIGTNYNIKRFTKNMLFDEKLGGTIHLALGLGFEEAGGKNASGLHWDMLCDMAKSEIMIDGKPFYKNGKPVI
ncbi:MAG TPA: aminopeptidase [Anaerolineales bacterium]|nr:aminopeptidase [Anaerolineales bacterium]